MEWGENMFYEEFEISLIVPFQYEAGHYDEINTLSDNSLNEYFQLKNIKCTIINMQNDDIWNNDQYRIMKCLEIRQKYRKTLGIYHREDQVYFFKKKPDIPFRISKVNCWCMQNGISYITLHIQASNLNEYQVLDLKSLLVNLKENNRIQYTVRMGVEKFDNKEITINKLIKSVITLLETLEPVEHKMTYSKALSLSYGIADCHSEEEMAIFSENMRLNKNSEHWMQKKIAKENIYIPEEFPYLYWTVSDYMMALTADINQAEKLSKLNGVFLRENMGPSVFSNYLMLYLYYWSIQEQCAKLERQCRMADKNMCMYPNYPEVLSLEKDVLEITTEPHINRLFFLYLCLYTWKLKERLSAIKEILAIEEQNEKKGVSADGQHSIFISYRRKYGGYVARLIYNELKGHNLKVFYDMKSMHTGVFDEQIYNAIKEASYVIVVLTPGCLRTSEKEDWMREEIRIALEMNKKIINVLVDGFDFSSNLINEIDSIRRQHGLHLNAEYIDSFMETLLEQIERDEGKNV